MSGGEGLSYTYDGPLMKTETWNGPVAGMVSRTTTTISARASRSVNGANPITFQYDNDSLLKQAGALSLNYSPQNGLPTGTALAAVGPPLMTTTATERSSATRHRSLPATCSGCSSQHDDLGRIITSKTETIGGVTAVYSYTYDIAGRLESEIVDGVTVATYAYD